MVTCHGTSFCPTANILWQYSFPFLWMSGTMWLKYVIDGFLYSDIFLLRKFTTVWYLNWPCHFAMETPGNWQFLEEFTFVSPLFLLTYIACFYGFSSHFSPIWLIWSGHMHFALFLSLCYTFGNSVNVHFSCLPIQVIPWSEVWTTD